MEKVNFLQHRTKIVGFAKEKTLKQRKHLSFISFPKYLIYTFADRK